MKKVILASIFVTSLVFGASSGADFPTKKTKIVETVEKKIVIMNEFKECVNKAADKNALKECKKAEHDKMKVLNSEMKSEKADAKGEGMGKSCHTTTESNATKK